MSRRTRIVLLTLIGPALLTVAFSVVVFGALYVVDLRYTHDQIKRGMLFFFAAWQLIAIWWLWRNWRNLPPEKESKS